MGAAATASAVRLGLAGRSHRWLPESYHLRRLASTARATGLARAAAAELLNGLFRSVGAGSAARIGAPILSTITIRSHNRHGDDEQQREDAPGEGGGAMQG